MICARRGLLLLIAWCLMTGAAERPRDPWVFRCVLDQRPRMVVLALHESLWVAYDATTCSLYKAWRGDVKFQGAVYDSVHGPQPVARGDVLIHIPDANSWSVSQDGHSLDAKTIWRGYRLESDQVTLLYELRTQEFGSIGIEERVDVEGVTGEHARLVRTITTRSVPPGLMVSIEVPAQQSNGETLPLTMDGTAIETDPKSNTQSIDLKSNGQLAISATVHIPGPRQPSSNTGKGGQQ